jgi:quinol monooxygenase YgiN
MIGIVAKLKVQAGKEGEFEKVFLNLRENVLANESGCKLYELYRSKDDRQTYVVMERYENDAAVDHHRKTDHFRAAGKQFQSILAGAPEVSLLDSIS